LFFTHYRALRHPYIVSLEGCCVIDVRSAVHQDNSSKGKDDENEKDVSKPSRELPGCKGLCILMELVELGSLRDVLKRGNVNLVQKLRMARTLAEGMKFAHEEKCIFHRDLKGSNILVMRP